MTGETRLTKSSWIVVLVLICGFVLRFTGVWFGLPGLYHADEPIIVNHALAYGSGDLNPHFFNIPPLISYLLFLAYGIYYLLGQVFGVFASPNDFVSLFVLDPSSFYLIARILFGVLIGTVTLYLLYRLAKNFFSAKHALLSATLLAFNFLHVRDSHYIYADIPLVAVLVLSFFPILVLADRFLFLAYIWFGVLIGIAAAIKYNGILVVIPFLAIHFIKHRARLIPLISAFLISIATYFICNPYSLLDFRFFLSELSEQGKSTSFMGFFHHLSYSASEGIGWLVLVCSLIGMAQSIFRRQLKLGLLSIFVLSYYAVLCFKSQPYDRYILPLVPFALLLASEGLLTFKNWFKLNQISYMVLIGALIFPSMVKVVGLDLMLLRKDTRTVAREWIETFVPSGSKVALDSPFYLPPLKPTLEQLEQKNSELEGANYSGVQRLRLEALMKQAAQYPDGRYELYFLKRIDNAPGFLFSKPEVPYDLAALKNLGIQYVVVGQSSRQENLFGQALKEHGDLVVRFTPYRDSSIQASLDPNPLTGAPFLWKDLLERQRNGPIIFIYRIKNS